MKALVADSSSLISLSMSCLFDIVPKLAKKGLHIIVPKAVFNETIAEPLHIKRFKLSAIRIRSNIAGSSIKIVEPNIRVKKLYREILQRANTCFRTHAGYLKILHNGEAEMLALARELNATGLLIDERTTRLLIECPAALRILLEKRNNMRVSMDEHKAEWFRKNFGSLAIVRSAELVALAYEKGLLPFEKSKEALEAALYAVKFAGCGISSNEIEDFLAEFKAQGNR